MRAIRIHETGGPEVMQLETIDDPAPGTGEALVHMESIGVNFVEVYYRKGLYKNPLPFTPGSEGAGTVVAVGAGVRDVSVGATTFLKSMDCLALRGMLALFGQSSGPVAPLDPNVLNQKGSIFLTRPTLGHYVATREELAWRAGDVLGWVRDGSLKLRIDREVPLVHAAEAHRALEGRRTTGKVLLVP